MAVIFSAALPTSIVAAGRRPVLPSSHPAVPGTLIACFDGKINRTFGKVEPWHCDFAGNLEFAGRLEGGTTRNTADGSFARLPVEGVWERIEWHNWGTSKSFGNEAVSARTGKRVSVHAYRRVRCADGSTWYARASIFNTDGGYDSVVRLPVCVDPQLRH